MQIPRAPIPGANYTSDTRNYPWHRPADIETYNEAVEHMLGRLETVSGVSLVYSMLEMEMPIATITNAMLLQSVSRGKLHIDMALVVAGPVARAIEIFAKRHGLKYEMGAEPDDEIVYTPTQLQLIMNMQQQDSEEAEMVPSETPEAPVGQESEGLMGMPTGDDIEAAPEEEQSAMLGMTEEEAPDELEG